MSQLFFCPGIETGTVELPEEEARHCIQVLRHQVGDILTVMDGRGGFFEARIVEVSKRKCVVEMLPASRREEKRSFFLQIAIAPTKSMDRFEWFIEKSVEIGIDAITPLLTMQSERRKIRHDRLEKVALAAAKQSLKPYLPRIEEMTSFGTFLQSIDPLISRYIACVSADPLPHLKDVCEPGQSMVVMIGPEGDFTPEEILAAREAGFQPVSLGKSRLRTETAGVVSCTIANLCQ